MLLGMLIDVFLMTRRIRRMQIYDIDDMIPSVFILKNTVCCLKDF